MSVEVFFLQFGHEWNYEVINGYLDGVAGRMEVVELMVTGLIIFVGTSFADLAVSKKNTYWGEQSVHYWYTLKI